jgi:PIN domain nuclease of toxin-antitoxin system
MILVDTHVVIWALNDDANLSPHARSVLANEAIQMYVSSVSAWEIGTKYRSGKLPGVAQLMSDFAGKLRADGYLFLSVSVDHSLLASSFTMKHKDPFDRLIVAQAMIEKIPLLSADRTLEAFPVERVW